MNRNSVVYRALLIVAVLGAESSTSIAASSFSSELYNYRHRAGSDGLNDIPFSKSITYTESRIFTEDDKTFYLRAFGCEFSIDSNLAGSDDVTKVVRAAKAKIEGKSFSGRGQTYRIEMIANLVGARKFDLSGQSPPGFSCNPMNAASALYIVKDSGSDGSKFYIYLIQYDTTLHPDAFDFQGQKLKTTMSERAEYRFVMKKDFFSPQQAVAAQQIAASVLEAILRAAPAIANSYLGK